MGLREIVISVLLMALVVIAFASFLGYTSTQYGSDYDNTTWTQDYVNVTGATQLSDEQSDLIESSATQTAEFEPFATGVGGTFTLVSKTKNTFSDMITYAFDRWSLSSYTTLILTVIIVIITFTIATVIWRFRA